MSDEASGDSTSDKLKRLRKAPPPFRRVVARSIEDLTPRMRRIVVGGEGVDAFADPQPGSSVRVLVPPPGGKLVLPEWTGNQFELDGERAPIRTFTPRIVDAARNELTIDIVLHDSGVATDWARTAVVGSEIAVSGPGRSDPFDAGAESHLLAGDESTIPAICQFLEAIPLARSVDVHIEVVSDDARIELPEHEGATITWHVAAPGVPPGSAMVSAVMAIDELPDAIWVAGEAASVQRLRKHLFDERGRDRSSVTARGYWKHGRAES